MFYKSFSLLAGLCQRRKTNTHKNAVFLHHLLGNINEGKLRFFFFFFINQSFYLKHHESKPQLYFVSLDLRCKGSVCVVPIAEALCTGCLFDTLSKC